MVGLLPDGELTASYEKRAAALASTSVTLLDRSASPTVESKACTFGEASEVGLVEELLTFHGTVDCRGRFPPRRFWTCHLQFDRAGRCRADQ